MNRVEEILGKLTEVVNNPRMQLENYLAQGKKVVG